MFDVYLIGVGGQGVLTVGELIATSALRLGLPVSFYPTKGMAQRGGFVKAQLRLGLANGGPAIAERGADLVLAMELSESLKGVRFIKPGGEFLLYGHVWAPTAVMLGQADYPAPEVVREQVEAAGGVWHYLSPDNRPLYEGEPVPANIYVLGAALSLTRLGKVLDAATVGEVVEGRWDWGLQRNREALAAGMAAREG